MKRMNIFFILKSIITIVFVLTQVFEIKATQNIETYPYYVIKNYGSFEIRKYEGANFTSVTMPVKTYKESSGEGFRTLASYIFGNNTSNKKIAMTSPVAMSMGDSITMKFLIPSKQQLETMPTPTNNKIKFTTEPAKTVAAISFGGWANDKKISAYTEKLKVLLAENKIVYTEAFTYLGYNSPFTIINRRNEIIVEIQNL